MMLSPAVRADWDRYRSAAARQEPFTPDCDQDEASLCVQAVYVRTPADDRIAAAIQSTLLRNGSTKRHWLGIDGPANLGKTEMVLNYCIGFDRTYRASSATQGSQGYAAVPVIFTEADATKRGAGLLRGIAEFAGLPSHGSEDVQRERLMSLLPRLGTRLVIVDDGHMLRRASSRSTLLTDSLRAALRLPVAFVFVGAGLNSSALLSHGPGTGYESSDQLRRRHSMISMAPLSLPRDAPTYRMLLGEYLRRAQRLLPHLNFPFRDDQKAVRNLFELTDGHTGAIMGALKDATVTALQDGAAVDTERLLACAREQLA